MGFSRTLTAAASKPIWTTNGTIGTGDTEVRRTSSQTLISSYVVTMDYEVSADPNFGTTVYTSSGETDETLTIPADTLAASTVYYARVRYNYADGSNSGWIGGMTFTTSPVPVTARYWRIAIRATSGGANVELYELQLMDDVTPLGPPSVTISGTYSSVGPSAISVIADGSEATITTIVGVDTSEANATKLIFDYGAAVTPTGIRQKPANIAEGRQIATADVSFSDDGVTWTPLHVGLGLTLSDTSNTFSVTTPLNS